MTGRNSAVSSASPPKPHSKSRRNAPHPPTRQRPRETLWPFGRESRAFFVSGWRCRDRPKANLRKFRGYSSDYQNQKYEAISEGFVAGGPGFEPRLTESESAMTVVRIFGYKERRRQIRQSRTNNRQWHLVSAASVSWRAILRASADERARRTKQWHGFRAPQSSSSHARSGERFEGPGRSPLWSRLWPFGPLPPSELAFRLVSLDRDEPAQGGQRFPPLRIALRRIRRAPDIVSSPGSPGLLAWP